MKSSSELTSTIANDHFNRVGNDSFWFYQFFSNVYEKEFLFFFRRTIQQTIFVLDHGLMLIRELMEFYGVLSIGHHNFSLGEIKNLQEKKKKPM